ncbi:putative membrane protein YdjX (TVP38/TMEM64 family) [Paenibacillus phyllosphaerae]|uniref:TVP38/TMEM64 family membrane protein n=1 Tax=Paenibacillus phyllosphaerae TaxID=274593 RepID=A0A7W5FNY9_9BACL|nr:TVP38/TMEM64 family protein [Paenibacillus phyllosphaerae]MBB3111821.1 putative membrane protein YdjX (TVP38/TMEM64 family) [Paenibacillus phyllosphaerae]
MSSLVDTLTSLTEEDLRRFLDQYRSLGPIPGMLLTFMKSFVPPLPTLIIVGVNAAVYGLWLGFLYSWIGMIAGCLTTFLIFRKLSDHPYADKWARKPKVRKSMAWVQRNAFGYVFLLSLSPVGPFVVINIAAALARMPLRSFLIAIAFGKAVMVMAVSIVGHDVSRFLEHPAELAYVLLFVVASFLISKWVESKFSREIAEDEAQQIMR